MQLWKRTLRGAQRRGKRFPQIHTFLAFDQKEDPLNKCNVSMKAKLLMAWEGSLTDCRVGLN
jgi:hypothetical protein